MVVRERESVISEIAQLRDSLERSVSMHLTQLEHRLKMASSSYGLRRPSDMLVQYEQRLDDARERISELQNRRLEGLEAGVLAAGKRLWAHRPERLIASMRDKIKATRSMFVERAGKALARREADLAELAARLDSLSPLAVLARGYSITYRLPAGEILRDSSKASIGDRIRVKLHQGSLACVIEKVEG
jgi:exodeoxyribonuclease VII large subunit